jgi:ubiquinone/menaquinone biosynthesis C-methylase UbiE
VRYLTDTPIEILSSLFPASTFNLVVSRAVLEHIYDIDSALDSMDRLLKPGGYMIHEVDLRDHGIFTRYGLHPLTFLTFGKTIWGRISSQNGSPNRVPMHKYVDYFEQRGYESEFLKKMVMPFTDQEYKVRKKEFEFGIDYDETALQMIRRMRPLLDSTFASLSDEDLLVGAFLIATRKKS